MNFWGQYFSAPGYKYGTNANAFLVAQAYRLPSMAFHASQLTYSSGVPKAREMLYTQQTLQEDFAGVLTEFLAWEGEVTLDEGPGHQGVAHVTRWIGRVAQT
jgi:hypothetical protein